MSKSAEMFLEQRENDLSKLSLTELNELKLRKIKELQEEVQFFIKSLENNLRQSNDKK